MAKDTDEETLPKPPHGRVKTPTIIQMEAVECGAAALGIVLAYHGRYAPLEELRSECGVSRDGSKAGKMRKAAERYGLKSKGYRKELEDLFELPLPSILFWNMNHFVVLEGFKGGKAYLNDPATGPRVVTMEELSGSFSGVVLTFEPGPDFEKKGSPPRLFNALKRRLAGSKIALSFVLLCGLFLVVPGLVVPTFARLFIDEYLVGEQKDLVKPLLVGMFVTAVIRMILTYLQENYLLRLETKLALVTSSDFFNHIMRLPVAYFGQRFAGEIGSRVAINDRVAQLLSGKLTTVTIDCVMVVFYAALMMLYDVPLTLCVIGLATLNLLAVQAASRRRVDAARKLKQDQGKLIGTAMNGLAMIETLKATGSESEFFARWSGYQSKSLMAEQTLGYLALLVTGVPPLVNSLATATVLGFGGLKVMNGEMTIGMLVAFQTLMFSFIRPLNTFVSFGAEVQELEADMNRIDDVLDYPQDPRYTRQAQGEERQGEEGQAEEATEEEEASSAAQGKGSTQLSGPLKLNGHVELRDVTFGYSPQEPPLIKNFNLEVRPGQRVALVGASGSGKSTIARLMTGLYEIWDGDILFDGTRRQELSPELVANSLAVVDQEIFLFSGTVQENLTLWDSTVPTASMTKACRDAEVNEVVETRNDAYQAEVTETGSNFSGGQRQRLEIARALVGDPTILILDEATSALDPSTEKEIDDHLRQRGCSCVIVAHRLSTIRDCDEIVVLRQGTIEDRGTHEELMSRGGEYLRLIEEA